ncbi:unnamed protein product [Chondrus crispus]|uniref:Uncharacterized protein n=1 Tax=Chondrus crispus TaxID=2769 RepID=R7QJ76_CHOCR|nr:unnamed protein product [Chondrus crispus]CDF38149.1 unnamed protein product [Chondrus crispus]|eukprot:XP_005718018.1 unnamed protein product [Chondrus crispus]
MRDLLRSGHRHRFATPPTHLALFPYARTPASTRRGRLSRLHLRATWAATDASRTLRRCGRLPAGGGRFRARGVPIPPPLSFSPPPCASPCFTCRRAKWCATETPRSAFPGARG